MIDVKMKNGEIKRVPKLVYDLHLKQSGGTIVEAKTPTDDLIEKVIKSALEIEDLELRKKSLQDILDTNPTGYVRQIKKELKSIDKLTNSNQDD